MLLSSRAKRLRVRRRYPVMVSMARPSRVGALVVVPQFVVCDAGECCDLDATHGARRFAVGRGGGDSSLGLVEVVLGSCAVVPIVVEGDACEVTALRGVVGVVVLVTSLWCPEGERVA